MIALPSSAGSTSKLDLRPGTPWREAARCKKARVTDTGRRLDLCRNAILYRDFQAFAEIVELDSNLMHAVMMTSQPQLYYWQPVDFGCDAVRDRSGVQVDSRCVLRSMQGPNVHVITTGENSSVSDAENLNQYTGGDRSAAWSADLEKMRA